jgi:hypothetical protein
VQALMGNHIQALVASPPEVIEQVRGGKMKVLAVMSDKRSAILPDVPTLKEKGIDLSIGTWRAIGAPAGTPDDTVVRDTVPPTATGIATYDRAVLDGLARIGFTRELPIDVVWPVDEHKAAYVPAYRLGVYQLGNNVDFHLQIYRTAWQAPGLVVLHDLALDDFVRGLQSVSDPLGYVAVREALQARDQLRSTEAGRNEPLRTPWAAAIARRSRGIVVHSQFCRRYLEEFGCKTPIYVVPHPPVTMEFIRNLGKGCKPVFLSEYGIGSMLDVIRGSRWYEQMKARPDLSDVTLFRAYNNAFQQSIRSLQLAR